MKKQTQATREFETRVCANPECGQEFQAPVKLHGAGVIGGGKCPNCIRSERPAREGQCPVCPRTFKIQAGHSRETCCRECQQIYTLRKRAEGAKAGASETLKIAEAMLKSKNSREAAIEAERRQQEETRRRMEMTEQKVAGAAKETERAIAASIASRGTALERLAAASETVKTRRKADNKNVVGATI